MSYFNDSVLSKSKYHIGSFLQQNNGELHEDRGHFYSPTTPTIGGLSLNKSNQNHHGSHSHSNSHSHSHHPHHHHTNSNSLAVGKHIHHGHSNSNSHELSINTTLSSSVNSNSSGLQSSSFQGTPHIPHSELAELTYNVSNRKNRSDSVQSKMKPNEKVSNIGTWAKYENQHSIFKSEKKKKNIFEKYTLRLPRQYEKGYLNQHYKSHKYLLRITNFIGIAAVSYGFTKKAIFMLIAIRILCFNLFAFSIFLSYLNKKDLYKKLFHPLFLFSFTTFFITLLLEYKTSTTTTLILFLYVVIFSCLYALGCLVFIWMVMCNLMNAVCFLIFIFLESNMDRNNLISFVIYILLMFLLGASHLYVLEKFRKESYIAKMNLEIESKKLREQREKSSTLLSNILPEFIIKNLKWDHGNQKVIMPEPEEFMDCSILCFDIVQFTVLSAQLKEPKSLVFLLTEVFREFDRVVMENNCQKIKTDGDAYICASGLKSKSEPDGAGSISKYEHCENLLKAAIEIMKLPVLRNNSQNVDIKFRCGLAMGSAYGGVMGDTKYQFDIWGDCIARAHSLEQSGHSLRVQVGEEIAELIRDRGHGGFGKYKIVENTDCEMYHNDEHHKAHGICLKGFFVEEQLTTSNTMTQISTDGAQSGEFSNDPISLSQSIDGNIHSALQHKKSQILLNAKALSDISSSPSSDSRLLQENTPPSSNKDQTFETTDSNSSANNTPKTIVPSFSKANISNSQSNYSISNVKKEKTSTAIQMKDMFKKRVMKYFKHTNPDKNKLEREEEEFEQQFKEITHINKWIISFNNPKIEFYFHKYVISNNVIETRFFLIIGLLLHLLFYLDDQIMDSIPYYNSNAIYLTMGIAFIVFIAFSFTKIIRIPLVYQISFFILLSSFGVCTVLELIRWENPLARSSLTRVCATLFYLNVFHSLNFLSVLFLNLFIFTFFIISCYYISPNLTGHLYETDYIGFVVVLIIQICSSYGMKLAMRRAWVINSKTNFKKINLKKEKDRIFYYLQSIFPNTVLEKIMHDEEKEGEEDKKIVGLMYHEYHQRVSIMFVQICSFKENDEPKEMIKRLDAIFKFFDGYLERYKGTVEKIKTIGNTYMCVSGLNKDPDFLQKMANFAIDLKSFIKSNKDVIKLGISVGPLVSGCMGLNRAKFDVWGDTANVASRMQSNAPNNEILITEEVYETLNKEFFFGPRNVIQVKGKGEMATYVLKGIKNQTWDQGATQMIWDQNSIVTPMFSPIQSALMNNRPSISLDDSGSLELTQ
ncbi:hypothetical protein DICPUDRAFT_51614 [Dictyostelium purpureum]|uniref:adenylate cyclase n=1 Tax=Dictyostelium purpureum TaxID=5786 RepID=F1A4L3_DICPU|nr:uncharacterized protein DICPUDRAFT_51614 [Dictyostelium purpureum]EGC28870.1 hypothetical protein DICPUDRAFT_51614 [Dictyostelium purpureum]|eukprot:XP_003294607.1 hypothetical protein DICPUDRAFT_51614 [Dictyostelium purpureum]